MGLLMIYVVVRYLHVSFLILADCRLAPDGPVGRAISY